MAYVAPRTWAAGEFPTAAQFNQDIRDNPSFLANPPACRVFHNANQSVPHNALTSLAFNSERFDTDTMHDTVTNNSRITFNTAGLYVVTGNGEFGAATDYTRVILDIKLNGTTIIARNGDTAPGTAGTGKIVHVSALYKAAAADFVQLQAFHENGAAAARNVDTIANYSPEFSAVWVGLG